MNAVDNELPDAFPSLHFVGIGGYGMSAVAQIFAEWGVPVSGSDLDDKTFSRLRAVGAKCFHGHDGAHIGDAEVVVTNTIVPSDNPELLAAKSLGRRIIGRGDALALACSRKTLIAVAGSHGKTTTSSMLTLALISVGVDPSFALGGYPIQLGTNGRGAAGSFAVAEIHEGDGTLPLFTPQVGIITNLDPDHLDHFGSADAYRAAFWAFARQVRSDGVLVVGIDDPACRQLALQLASEGREVVTYGKDADARVRYSILDDDLHPKAVVETPTTRVSLRLAIPGGHNVENATAVIAAAVALKLDVDVIVKAVNGYVGAERRYEPIDEPDGIKVIDDYAHHPTEMAVILKIARKASTGRVIACLRPLRYTRTRDLGDEIAAAVSVADHVVVMDPIGGQAIPGVDGPWLVDLIRNRSTSVSYASSPQDAVTQLQMEAKPNDVVLTLGAHDVNLVARDLARQIRSRAAHEGER